MSKLGWVIIALVILIICIVAFALMETVRRQDENERRRQWEQSIRERLKEQKERESDA